MQAVILAGGKGERLLPLTYKVPKGMVKVAGKPVLEHTIQLLRQHGVMDFVLVLHYLADQIKNYFASGSKFGVHIRYLVETVPHGTAGAILPLVDKLQDDFIVTYGDILRQLDIRRMIKAHFDSQALATINVYKRQAIGARSFVKLAENRQVLEFVERPRTVNSTEKAIWANGSLYIFNRNIFNFIPRTEPADFGRDIFPRLVTARKKIYAYPTTGYFVDIGTTRQLKEARRTFRNFSVGES